MSLGQLQDHVDIDAWFAKESTRNPLYSAIMQGNIPQALRYIEQTQHGQLNGRCYRLHTSLSLARAMGHQDVITALALKGVTAESDEISLNKFEDSYVYSKIRCIKPLLFDSDRQLFGDFDGGNPATAISYILGYLIDYPTSNPLARFSINRVIDELRQAASIYYDVEEGDEKEIIKGTIVDKIISMIAQLPPFNSDLNPSLKPHVLIAGGTEFHAVFYSISNDRYGQKLTIINTGEASKNKLYRSSL